MDNESVAEFLGGVPLLQRLPRSSLLKIAEVIYVKSFEKGEYVIREGEVGEGLYIIWEGEAEVSGFVNEEERRPEFLFQRYDYFGNGLSDSGQHVDVVTLTKLTCVVLPHQHLSLLSAKSLWNADRGPDSCPLAESILHLEPIDMNLFKGITLPDAPSFGKVFGGQFVGQALAAATKTVDCLKIINSMHAYFLRVGDLNVPILYQVDRVRDGRNFATRRVDAIQKGNIVFTLLASFQKEEKGFEHQEITIPAVPDPEMLMSMEELRERRLTDARFPRSYRNKVATKRFVPWPIEIRFCDVENTRTKYSKSPPSLNFWFRAKGKLSDDQALHRCVVAYASDLIFLQVSLNPHRRPGLRTSSVSLDHAMWFHRPLRADDWILFAIESPAAHSARGFVKGNMFNTKGEHVVSLIQEGLLRMLEPNPTPSSKL